MKKVLILIGSYLPGKNSAGVTTSIYNMINNVSSVDFYILTEDRDLGDKKPYKNIKLEEWTRYEKANIFYSSQYIKSLSCFRKIILSKEFDIYYVNGFYNIKDNLRFFILYFLKLIPQKKLIIAPRGIFSMGSFNNKKFLRYVYRNLFKCFGLLKFIHWHATSELEKNDIIKYFKRTENMISIIPNLNSITINKRTLNKKKKQKGEISILFISRISEKKNIKFILETIKSAKGSIQLDIYGMVGTAEDKLYLEQCLKIMKDLPKNINCKYYGPIEHDKVPDLYKSHHLFFLPTFGENYGHVIAESLSYGCPVLLSDTTPWNMVNKYKAGWTINLKRKALFKEKLQECIDLDQKEWETLSNNAIDLALNYIDYKKISFQYEEYFQKI